MTQAFHNEPLSPSEPSEIYAALAQAIAGADLVKPDTGERIAIPAEVRPLIQELFEALASGKSVTTSILHQRLTTQEAAEILGISRPSFVKLLESGAIPFETTPTGKHRRVLLADLMKYRQVERTRRREILDQMMRDAIEAGLYEEPFPVYDPITRTFTLQKSATA